MCSSNSASWCLTKLLPISYGSHDQSRSVDGSLDLDAVNTQDEAFGSAAHAADFRRTSDPRQALYKASMEHREHLESAAAIVEPTDAVVEPTKAAVKSAAGNTFEFDDALAQGLRAAGNVRPLHEGTTSRKEPEHHPAATGGCERVVSARCPSPWSNCVCEKLNYPLRQGVSPLQCAQYPVGSVYPGLWPTAQTQPDRPRAPARPRSVG